jgi:hypothetical protein
MQPIILVNGPPGSGKDTLGKHLVERYPQFEIAKFAWEIKERTHSLYGRPELPHDHFEEVKDIPSGFFMGLTPRQAYIHVSEMYFKPVHGQEVFGNLLVKHLTTRVMASGYVITDSGFESEAVPVLRHYGSENCILVRINGRGTFSNDSRSYITLPIETIDIYNTYSVRDFLKSADFLLDRILQPKIAEEFV